MRLFYLKRYKTLLIGVDTKPTRHIAVVMEGDASANNRSAGDLVEQLQDKNLAAVVYPFLQSRTPEATRDFYLQQVGKLLDQNVVYIDLEGEIMPLEGGPIVKTRRFEGDSMLVTVEQNGLSILIVPMVSVDKEKVELPTGVQVVVGEGALLSKVPDLFQVPFVVLVDKVDIFTQQTGVSDVQERREFSISASKISEDAQTQIVAL